MSCETGVPLLNPTGSVTDVSARTGAAPPAPTEIAANLSLRAQLCVLVIGCATTTACDRGSEAVGELPLTEFTEPTYFEADSLIHDIQDLRVAKDGTVWALASLDPFLYRWDADGRLVGRFGRQGGGPEEFLNPVQLTRGSDDTGAMIVWDVGRRALVPVSTLGSIERATTTTGQGGVMVSGIEQRSHGDPLRLRRLGDRLLRLEHAGLIAEGSNLANSAVVAFDVNATDLDTVIAFTSLTQEPYDPDTRQLLAAIPLWTVCDETVVIYDPYPPEDQQLLWLTANGETRSSTPLDASPPHLTDEDLWRYMRHRAAVESPDDPVPDHIISQAIEKGKALETFGHPPPTFVDIRCAETGEIWLEEFSTDWHPLGYGREWWIVDRAGPRLRARFPRGFRPYWIGEDRIIGVQTDDLGVQRLASFRRSGS